MREKRADFVAGCLGGRVVAVGGLGNTWGSRVAAFPSLYSAADRCRSGGETGSRCMNTSHLSPPAQPRGCTKPQQHCCMLSSPTAPPLSLLCLPSVGETGKPYCPSRGCWCSPQGCFCPMAAFPRCCAPRAGSARLCRAAAPHPSPERAGERSVLPFSGGDAAGRAAQGSRSTQPHGQGSGHGELVAGQEGRRAVGCRQPSHWGCC